MADILSQEEIEALLDVVEDEEDSEDEDCFLSKQYRQITLYDFKRPNRFSRDELRGFRRLHDKMAKILSVNLSKKLKTITEIQLHSVDQMTYGEFLMSIPNPTNFNIGTMDPLTGEFCLEVSPSIMFPILDRLLCGNGDLYEKNREFTEIEQVLIKDIISMFEDSLNLVFNEIAPAIEVTFTSQETSPNVNQITAQNEIVIMITMEVIIGQSSGMVNIAYPFTMIEPILPLLDKTENILNESKNIFKSDQLDSLLDVKIELLAHSYNVTLNELLNLSVGDFIPISKRTNIPKPILFVNGNPLFSTEYIEIDSLYKSFQLKPLQKRTYNEKENN